MKKSGYFIFGFVLALLFYFGLETNFVFAEEKIFLSDSSPEQRVGKSFYYLKDENSEFSFEQISSPEFAGKFIKCEQDAPNFGNVEMTIWNKFTVVNNSENQWVIYVPFYNIDTLVFYYPDTDGVYRKITTGASRELSTRKYKVNSYVFDLPLLQKDTAVFYLKVDTYIFQYPVIVATHEKFIETNHYRDMLLGIYFGFMLLIVLYNTAIFITVRDKNYLVYVIYVILVGWLMAEHQGLNAYLFGDRWHNLLWSKGSVITALSSMFSFIFAQSFLETKKNVPALNRIINFVFIPAFVVIMFLKFFGYSVQASTANQLVGFAALVFLTYISVIIYRKGFKPARYYFIACGLYFLGAIIYILKTMGILPYNNFTNAALMIGSALEMTMFSISLADKINHFKKEKEIAQANYVDTLHENERLIREQNKTLEVKVHERTAELENTLENLKRTQAQLVQSEKLVSLGLLTAGIAHEINNPINFVSASVPSLRRNFGDVIKLVSELNAMNLNPEQKVHLEELYKKLDIDATIKETETLLKGIAEGANRTSEIVKDLQNFSRVDESEMKTTNIHNGIESTLALLKNKITDSIEVKKEFGNIPSIRCYAGQLNQVFMNMLNNAIDAIPEKGTITIRTAADQNRLRISVSDTGTGMTEEVKKKIFDPFFTTKDVGKGTGLGLAVSYGIIERHGGTIEVNSEPGKGTEFVVSIPVTRESSGS